MTRGAWRRGGRLMLTAFRNLAEDHAFNHAAAVAYYSLLALIPSFYLAGRVLRVVTPGLDREDAAMAGLSAFLPPEVGVVVRDLLASVPRGDALVAVAIPGLVWVASTAFSAFEVSVNVAFGTSRSRLFWLSRLKSFLGFSAVVLVLLLGMVVNHATSWINHYRHRMQLPPALAPTVAWISYACLLAVSFCAFATFYKALPRGKVAWSAATVASGVTVLLWEGARRLFGALLVHSPAYGLLTGVLAAVVALLLWIYVAVLIALYGAEVAALLNGNRPLGAHDAAGAARVP